MGAGEILATDGEDDRDDDEVTPESAGILACPGSAGIPACPGSAGIPACPGSAGIPACPGSAGILACAQRRRQAMASWQASVISTFIRMIVKRRPDGNEAEVVESIR